MGKRVPQLNEAAAALQSDPAASAGAANAAAMKSTEKGLRSKDAQRASSGDLVPPVSSHQPEDANVKGKESGSLFERLKSRIRGSNKPADGASNEAAAAEEFLRRDREASPLEREIESAPRKGELANAIRLEAGQEKLLVNQRKLTDKVRKLLLSIEAQDTYLKSIALKVVSKKHQGVVIDLPKRKDGDGLESEHDGPLAKLLGRKSNKD